MMRASGGRSAAAIGVLCALELLVVMWAVRPGPLQSLPAAREGPGEGALVHARAEEELQSVSAGPAAETVQPDQGQKGAPGDAPPDSPPAAETAQPYDFSRPAPAGEAVDKDYFADAAFIGDSRTDGFMLYSGIGCGENLSSNGLSIFKLEEKKALTIDGEKYTLLEALALKEYGKVYLSLGVNELGYNNDQGFYRSYCRAVETIRALQPHAVIYLQGLIPLNEQNIAQTGGAAYLTNEHLRVYNQLMLQVAQEKQVVFLDLYSEFADQEGQLPPEASKDGIHLRADGCRQWLAYLQTHTVEYHTLYPEGAAAQPGDQGEEPT